MLKLNLWLIWTTQKKLYKSLDLIRAFVGDLVQVFVCVPSIKGFLVKQIVNNHLATANYTANRLFMLLTWLLDWFVFKLSGKWKDSIFLLGGRLEALIECSSVAEGQSNSILTRPGSSQHLSRLAHDVLQTISNIWSWNCEHTKDKYYTYVSWKQIQVSVKLAISKATFYIRSACRKCRSWQLRLVLLMAIIVLYLERNLAFIRQVIFVAFSIQTITATIIHTNPNIPLWKT